MSTTLRGLLKLTDGQRIAKFYADRFGGSAGNVVAAFGALRDGLDIGPWDKVPVTAEVLMEMAGAPSGRDALDLGVETAAPDAVLIADGAFLQRPELDEYWDLRIYVDVSFETVLRRGAERDAAWMDSPQAAAHRYRTRYIPGEQLYITQIAPAARAQLVINNEDPAHPVLTRHWRAI
jgi:hypothetical protein